MIGTTVSHYRVLEKIGEGGMGAVYRARDLHLERDVALKVLPPERMQDPERRRRFVLEARTAGSLEHPGIVSVYDIDEADGVTFIAMELVKGETLLDLLRRGPMPVERAVRIGEQIADALARAHAAGIVHRDLKPANVMVTEDGRVKVLDFGLAKLAQPQTPGAELTRAETETFEGVTAEGVVVGTAAYMSPEQAQGKKVDARTDVFSFGVVLHEMLSGQSPFRRDSTAATLAALLHEEPPRLEGVPPELARIVSRCLRRDPSKRTQSMADVRLSLEELREEDEAAAPAPAAGAAGGAGDAGGAPVPTGAAPSRLRSVLWAIAAFVALALLAVGVWFGHGYVSARRETTEPVPLTSYEGLVREPALSPDGRQVAFSWNGEKQDNFDVYVKLVGPGVPLRLTRDPADDVVPAWSPDGTQIAFRRRIEVGRSAVMVVPAMGGPERRIAEGRFNGRLAWSRDARFLFASERGAADSGQAIRVLSVGSGELRTLTTPPAGAWAGDVMPAISPDGRTLAFARSMTRSNSEIYLLSLTDDLKAAGEPRRLTFEGTTSSEPAFTPDGRRIVFSVGAAGATSNPRLLSIPVSGHGEKAEPLTVGQDGEWPTVAGSRLVYARWQRDENIWRLPLPPGSGPPERFISSTRRDIDPCNSPDGKAILFTSDRSGSHQVWLCGADGSNPRAVTSLGGTMTSGGRFSPDGKTLVFVSNEDGQMELYTTTPEGATPRRLTTNPAHDSAPSFSRDGKRIYFASNRDGGFQVWRMAPEPGAEPVRVTRGGGFAALESLDGRTLYYARPDPKSGWSVWKVPVADGVETGEETPVIPRIAGWGNFDVTAEGLVYIDSPGVDASLRLLRFTDGANVLLTPLGKRPSFGVSAAPDGSAVLYTRYDVEATELMLVEGFR